VAITLLVVVLVTSSMHRYVSGDVTGTNPTVGSCLCLTSSSVNVRDAGKLKGYSHKILPPMFWSDDKPNIL